LDLVDLTGKVHHGKYEGARSNKKVLGYCHKDGNYISSKSWEELQAIYKARENKSRVAGEMILAQGKITTEFIQAYPEVIFSGNL